MKTDPRTDRHTQTHPPTHPHTHTHTHTHTRYAHAQVEPSANVQRFVLWTLSRDRSDVHTHKRNTHTYTHARQPASRPTAVRARDPLNIRKSSSKRIRHSGEVSGGGGSGAID
jgi:hypothetical protein